MATLGIMGTGTGGEGAEMGGAGDMETHGYLLDGGA